MAHDSVDLPQRNINYGPGDSEATGVATGRFAEAGADRVSDGIEGDGPIASRRWARPFRGRRAATTESEREARVSRALRAAEGDSENVEGTDWRALGIFGMGVAIGVLVGAGTALLLAPASGFETRARLLYSARQTRDRVGRGARQGSGRLARDVSRKLTRSRWALEDAVDRRGRRRREG